MSAEALGNLRLPRRATSAALLFNGLLFTPLILFPQILDLLPIPPRLVCFLLAAELAALEVYVCVYVFEPRALKSLIDELHTVPHSSEVRRRIALNSSMYVFTAIITVELALLAFVALSRADTLPAADIVMGISLAVAWAALLTLAGVVKRLRVARIVEETDDLPLDIGVLAALVAVPATAALVHEHLLPAWMTMSVELWLFFAIAVAVFAGWLVGRSSNSNESDSE